MFLLSFQSALPWSYHVVSKQQNINIIWQQCSSIVHIKPCNVCVLFLAWAQNSMSSVVVEARNLTVPAGSDVVLPCHNQRMVWRQDRLRDRQRVVHWDLIRNQPDYTVERILDMFSGGTERLYNDYNRGRITISKDAFSDGNFSLVINSRFIL